MTTLDSIVKPQYLINLTAKRPLQVGQVVFVPAVVEAVAPSDALNPKAISLSVMGMGTVPLRSDDGVYALIGDSE